MSSDKKEDTSFGREDHLCVSTLLWKRPSTRHEDAPLDVKELSRLRRSIKIEERCLLDDSSGLGMS